MTDSSSQQEQGSRHSRLVQSVQMGVQKKQEEMREAKEAKEAGKIYNAETKEWYFYLLDEEWRELEQQQQETGGSSHETTTVNEKEVADREYYDLLEVSPSADAATIKRGYYHMARQWHPDKNPDNPEAHEKFQSIGHAYQVLSNPTTRAAYDKNGKTTDMAAQQASEVDAFVFFNVMFGSSLVEPYIGELWLASQADAVMQDDGIGSVQDAENMTEEERGELMAERIKAMSEKDKVQQRKRQVKCAQNLRTRIESYNANDDPTAFAQGCREEATKIVAGAYGSLYCITIGFALEVAAEEYLGFETSFLGLGGHMARTKKNASSVASNWALLGAGIKAATAGSKAMREAEDMQQRAAATEGNGGGLDETKAAQEMAETLDESLPAFLEFAWAINKRDIQSTLKQVCNKLFDDASVPKEMRFQRAQAVQILGREFQAIGKDATSNNTTNQDFQAEDIKARVAVATMTTMAKAQGQEVTEQDQQDMMQQAKQMSMDAKAGVDGSKEANTDETKGEQEANKTPNP